MFQEHAAKSTYVKGIDGLLFKERMKVSFNCIGVYVCGGCFVTYCSKT